MTVYRALETLIGRGLVRKVASLNAFVATTPETHKGIGALVICSKCGRTRSIGIQRKVVESLLTSAGITISDVFIEAFGDCGSDDCGDRHGATSHAS